MKQIYFAGGCFWGTEHYIGTFEGVSVQVLAETLVVRQNVRSVEPDRLRHRYHAVSLRVTRPAASRRIVRAEGTDGTSSSR